MSAVYGYDDFVKEERSRASWQMGDYPMWLYISSKYKIYFFEEILAVYRVLENSASHRKDKKEQINFVKSIYDIAIYFAKENRLIIMSLLLILKKIKFLCRCLLDCKKC